MTVIATATMKITPVAIPKNGISSSGVTARSSTSALLPARREQSLGEVETLLGLGQLGAERVDFASQLAHVGFERGRRGRPPGDPLRQRVTDVAPREDREPPDQDSKNGDEREHHIWIHRRSGSCWFARRAASAAPPPVPLQRIRYTLSRCFTTEQAGSGDLDRPDVGQPHRDFGIVGARGSEVHLERGWVGVDAGRDTHDFVVVGGGDPDRLLMAAGVIQQLHDRLVSHPHLVAGGWGNVPRSRARGDIIRPGPAGGPGPSLRATAATMRLADLFKTYRWGIALALGLVVVENVAWIAEPSLFGPVLDALISVANKEPHASAVRPLAAWIAVFAVNSIVGAVRRSVDPRI